MMIIIDDVLLNNSFLAVGLSDCLIDADLVTSLVSIFEVPTNIDDDDWLFE